MLPVLSGGRLLDIFEEMEIRLRRMGEHYLLGLRHTIPVDFNGISFDGPKNRLPTV